MRNAFRRTGPCRASVKNLHGDPDRSAPRQRVCFGDIEFFAYALLAESSGVISASQWAKSAEMASCWMHMEALLLRLQAYCGSGSGPHKCRPSNLTVLSDLRGCLLMECHTLQRCADIGHAARDQQAFGLTVRLTLHDLEQSRSADLRRFGGHRHM